MINVLCDFSEAGGYAELFAYAYRRRILDFAVSWNRTRALSGGIEIDAVAAARIKRQPFFSMCRTRSVRFNRTDHAISPVVNARHDLWETRA